MPSLVCRRALHKTVPAPTEGDRYSMSSIHCLRGISLCACLTSGSVCLDRRGQHTLDPRSQRCPPCVWVPHSVRKDQVYLMPAGRQRKERALRTVVESQGVFHAQDSTLGRGWYACFFRQASHQRGVRFTVARSSMHDSHQQYISTSIPQSVQVCLGFFVARVKPTFTSSCNLRISCRAEVDSTIGIDTQPHPQMPTCTLWRTACRPVLAQQGSMHVLCLWEVCCSSSCPPRLVDPPAVVIAAGANHVAVLHAAIHQNFTRLHS